jgi:hypothetical protein
MDLINTHIPLEKTEMQIRKNLLSNIKYKIFLNFSKININNYDGFVKIEFVLSELKDENLKIFLDYEGIISSFKINDNIATEENFNKNLNRVTINNQGLKIGLNKLEIKFCSLINDHINNKLKFFTNSKNGRVFKLYYILVT